MAGEDDLVSKVSVTGTEESAAKLEQYANTGAAAFDKLDKAANKASSDVSRAAKNIETSSQQASRGLSALGSVNLGGLASASADLDLLHRGTKSFVTTVRSGLPQLTSFVTRLVGVGTAAAAAGVGLLKAAQTVAKGSGTATDAIDKQTEAQVASNNSALQGEIASINLASSQRQLFQQFQRGEISFSDYSKALKKLNTDFAEQQRVAAQVENAQERVRLENERLQKQAADSKAFREQVALFGGPLLSSLTALGNAAQQVFNSFRDGLGPGVSAALDVITKTLTTNGAAISKFFADAGKQIGDFVAKNGPAIQQALETVGTFATSVFKGLIDALPGLIDLFNNGLVPAAKAFGAVLDSIATAVNSVFGTQLTGGAIVVIAIIAQLTGAFQALFTVIRLFISVGAIIAGLPFGPVLLAIAAAIAVLLIVFPQLRQVALDILNSIINAFRGMLAGAQAAGAGIVAAFTATVQFFQTLFQTIGAAFTAGWQAIVDGVTTVIDAIKTAWNGVVQFFSDLTTSIGQFFTDLWNSVVDAFNTAVNTIKSAFNSLLSSARAALQPIIDLLKSIISLIPQAGGTAAATGGSVTAAGGGHIRGPGTSTSDSIPAWLSDNEFVIQAKRVRQYGVGFLHAINQGRFKMPKFNLGGLVSSMISPMPRFAYAEGGSVKSPATLRPLNLNLFGEAFNGLLAPEDVGERLTKFAVRRGNQSAGRKPAWLGRGRN